MVNASHIKKLQRADYFLFQKTQKHIWETVKKSSSLEEVKKEFVLNYRTELNGKFRIMHFSLDNSHQRWSHKVVLLVNTNYLNQPFIELIYKTLDNATFKKSAGENCTRAAKVNTIHSKLNIKKKSYRTLILAIAFIFFFSSCATVGGVLYFKFPLVFQQVTELIFSSF